MNKIPNPALIREREEAARVKSEVKTYFDPSAFEWIGRNEAPKNCLPYIRFGRQIYISAAAVRQAGLKRGDKVVFGFNKKYFAVRKAKEEEKGFLLSQSSAKDSQALVFSGAAIVKSLYPTVLSWTWLLTLSTTA